MVLLSSVRPGLVRAVLASLGFSSVIALLRFWITTTLFKFCPSFSPGLDLFLGVCHPNNRQFQFCSPGLVQVLIHSLFSPRFGPGLSPTIPDLVLVCSQFDPGFSSGLILAKSLFELVQHAAKLLLLQYQLSQYLYHKKPQLDPGKNTVWDIGFKYLILNRYQKE